jgi:hypothetical protein
MLTLKSNTAPMQREFDVMFIDGNGGWSISAGRHRGQHAFAVMETAMKSKHRIVSQMVKPKCILRNGDVKLVLPCQAE